MAHIDGPTEKFMTALSGTAEAPRTVDKVAESSRSVAPKLNASGVVEELQKEGGLSPLKLFGFLNEHHEQSWWDWEPETLWTVLGVEHGIQPTEALRDLVMALQTIVSTAAPFEHWHAFEKVGHALCGTSVDFQVVQPLEPDQVALTCKILAAIRPQEKYEPEVLGYMAACCHSAGMVYLPHDFFPVGAQTELARIAKDYSGVGCEVTSLPHGDDGAWPRPAVESDSPAIKHQIGMLQEIREFVKNG